MVGAAGAAGVGDEDGADAAPEAQPIATAEMAPVATQRNTDEAR